MSATGGGATTTHATADAPAPRLRQAFHERFGAPATWRVHAPGRVNLLGEHTDYNQGFVLPMAIERAIWIALRPRDDRRVRVLSLDLGEEQSFDLDAFSHDAAWIEYVKGVARVLKDEGLALRGFDGVLAGDIPMGAGLSSSAALSVSVARAFCALAGIDWDPLRAARWAQRAENEWVGLKCGIMDPLISAAGRAGHALLVDCRDLALRPVPLPPGCAVAVLDTGTRRGLVDSAYNERRERCEAAARALGAASLRDVTPDELARRAGELTAGQLEVARHVVSENARTLRAAEALERRDPATFGALMGQGHASLRDDLRVSSPALDAIVLAAHDAPGCFGARMTGAGFAGCAVALVDEARADAFTRAVLDGYRARTGRDGTVYLCHPAGPAHAERLE